MPSHTGSRQCDPLYGLIPPHWNPCSLASVTALANMLNVDPSHGLSSEEAARRLEYFGPNIPLVRPGPFWWEAFIGEVKEPMILLLILIGTLYSAWGEFMDSLVFFGLISLIVGTEVHAVRQAYLAVRALSNTVPVSVMVLRDRGIKKIIPSPEVVPGDLIILGKGQRAPADGCVVRAFGLKMDESAITGESVPTGKVALGIDVSQLSENTTIHPNFVCAGSLVTAGRGTIIATATGAKTRLNKMSAETHSNMASMEKTPTHILVNTVASNLTKIALLCAVVIPVLGILQGVPWRAAILSGMSLAFATIPEKLLAIVQNVLAVGACKLAEKRILVRRLHAAEALGSVTAIVSDKTGTMTRNQLQVTSALVFSEKRQPSVLGASPASASSRSQSSTADGAIECIDVVPRIFKSADVTTEHVGQLQSLARTWALSLDSANLSREISVLSGSTSPSNGSVFQDVFDEAISHFFLKSPHPKCRSMMRDAMMLSALRYPTATAELPFRPVRKLSAICRAAPDSIIMPPSSPSKTGFAQIPSDSITIVKGAPEMVLPLCSRVWLGGQVGEVNDVESSAISDPLTNDAHYGMLTQGETAQILDRVNTLAREGSRILMYAYIVKPSYEDRSGPSSRSSSRPTSAQSTYRPVSEVFNEDGSNRNDITTIPDVELRNLILVGAIAFSDPLRPEVVPAVNACQQAGIRVIIATGDHPDTAAAVGKEICLGGPIIDYAKLQTPTTATSDLRALDLIIGKHIARMSSVMLGELAERVNIFARVDPQHKLRIVQALSSRGHVVALIGDGVNDSLALSAADVGIAIAGDRFHADTAVDTATVVLLDGRFGDLLIALQEGQRMMENIRKTIVFYLACKLTLVAGVAVAVLAEGRFPLGPVQLILLKLLMDLGAGATYVSEPTEDNSLDRAISPAQIEGGVTTDTMHERRKIFTRGLKYRVFAGGTLLFVICGISYLHAFLYPPHSVDPLDAAGTACFFTWLFGHVSLGATLRTWHSPVVLAPRNTAFDCWAFGVILLSVSFGFLFPDSLRERFALVDIDLEHWLIGLGGAAAIFICFEGWKVVDRWHIVQRENSNQDATEGERSRLLT